MGRDSERIDPLPPARRNQHGDIEMAEVVGLFSAGSRS